MILFKNESLKSIYFLVLEACGNCIVAATFLPLNSYDVIELN